MTTTFYNYTPHSITLNSGEKYDSVGVARVSNTFSEVDENGICSVNYGDITGLPEPKEGCTNYSCLINGVEWTTLCDKGTRHYNIDLLDDVIDALIDEAQKQYDLPNWIIDCLYDDSFPCCTQDTFVMLVRNNKRAKLESPYHCDECGDDIFRTTLKINVNYGDNHKHTR